MNKVNLSIKSMVFWFGLCLFSQMTAAQTWQLTPSAQLGFRIQSLGVKIVEGKFEQVDAELWFDPQQLARSSTQFSLYVDRLRLNKPALSPMIMGKDLFDAAQFKTVQFKSTQFRAKGNQRYEILGQLTLRGVTRAVRFDATIRPDGTGQRLWVDATTKISRSQFGMRKAVGSVGEYVDIYLKGDWTTRPDEPEIKSH